MKFTVVTNEKNCPIVDDVKQAANEWGIPVDVHLKEQIGSPQIAEGDKLVEHQKVREHINENFEPILQPSLNRFTTFPIEYPGLWELYEKAVASFWTAQEVDLAQDMNDWEKLNDNERHFIKNILAFFASADGIVMENINVNFAQEVQISEARSFYAYQEFNESIHGQTYSLLIEKYIQDPIEKSKCFQAIKDMPCVARKAQWALKWFDESLPFRDRLIAFACVEGIFFSGSFCAIFWLKKRGLMPGLSFSNQLISRDEALHQEFAVELHETLQKKCSRDRIHEIVRSAVEIEKEFIIDALPCKLIGMDSQKMGQYIEYVADRLLKQIGVPAIWGTPNPFDWMEAISLEGKTNFFEGRVSEYNKHELGEVMFDEDF